jgi:hypothetical protein
MRVSREYLDTICEDNCGDSDHAWWISSQIENALDTFINYLNDERHDFMGRIEVCPTLSHEFCDCMIINEKVDGIPCEEHA